MKINSEPVSEGERMLNIKPLIGPIEPKRARFPCCIVWTPLPIISWFIPVIGHIGICREDGIILDFAGPNFVCVDNFAFGAVARYLQITKEQCLELMDSNRVVTWDELVKRSTQDFQHRSYSLFTCNCHSFVANNLNRMSYGGHDKWNVLNLAVLIFLKGKWVSKTSILRSYLPFVVVMSIGYFFGGSKFFIGVLGFALALIGWFLVGTYCFRNLIDL